MLTTIRSWLFILNHPLNRGNKWLACSRYLRWQVGSRLVRGAVAVPFVNDLRLLVTRGMTGATGNIYCGLHEFEDMSFVLHAMRPGDVFVDVGANIGSYTLLAVATGCTRCISIEPSPDTFVALKGNLALNGIHELVELRQLGVGAGSTTMRFTSGLDTVNHLLAEGEIAGSSIDIEVQRLDDIIGTVTSPTIVKIDVEGFETEVLSGASAMLESHLTWAVIMELNGSGQRYGFDEQALHKGMLGYGFMPMTYDPFRRNLTTLPDKNSLSGNTLYIKNADVIRERLRSAPTFSLPNGII